MAFVTILQRYLGLLLLLLQGFNYYYYYKGIQGILLFFIEEMPRSSIIIYIHRDFTAELHIKPFSRINYRDVKSTSINYHAYLGLILLMYKTMISKVYLLITKVI